MADEAVDLEKLQKIFDLFGDVPGSILVRGPDRWIALEPGNLGDVLVIGDGGVPEWRKPEDVSFGG